MACKAHVCLLFSLAFFVLAAAAQPGDADSYTPPNMAVSFRPSVAIVIGVFSIMFSLTFLLLIYAKFCHSVAASSPSSDLFSYDAATGAAHGRFVLPQHRFSGIDKSVIESLPFFRFSALRGVRAGLECAVCLAKFDDAELLRLLPKCRHAFHVACVDRWLESHSSCPLCRCRVKAEDAALLKFSASARLLFAAASDRDLDLFVEREPDDCGGSARFSVGGSFRKTDKAAAKEDEEQDLPILEDQFLHKFKHRIIVSDVVFKSRWSDVNSSDLISLNSEMLSTAWNAEPNPIREARAGGGGFEGEKATLDEKVRKIKEEMEKKRQLENKASELNKINPTFHSGIPSNTSNANSQALVTSSGNRSMSEITNLSRFRQVNGSTTTDDERVARVWLPIAKRTVQWFAGREMRSQNPESSGGRGGEPA